MLRGDTYSSKVPPSPSTKDSHYCIPTTPKQQGPILANRYIIPTGSNRRKGLLCTRDVYIYTLYSYMYHAIQSD